MEADCQAIKDVKGNSGFPFSRVHPVSIFRYPSEMNALFSVPSRAIGYSSVDVASGALVGD